MESAPILIDPRGLLDAAAGPAWATAADDELNQSTGWSQEENKPFFFLAQPPQGEVFEKISYKTGEMRLIGTVKRMRTDELTFQGGEQKGQLTFYPDRVTKKYWHEAAVPQHSINAHIVTVKHDDPQYVLTVTYEFSALQFRYTPPPTALAEGKTYTIAFDLHSKEGA